MNLPLHPSPPPGAAAGAADAEARLAQVQHKVDAARAVLLRLLQEVVVAESRLSTHQAAQMLEANEQLVVTALRSQAESLAASQALHDANRSAELDPLTRLPNRALLVDRFAQAIAAARRRSAGLALLFLDLNDFKHVNDTLGHAAGDLVLQKVALRLGQAVRAADTVSRHGGDEFVILLTEVSQPADAEQIAAKLLSALAEPCAVGNQVLRLTACIGISLFPGDGSDVKTLIDRADAAMYRAKRLGPGSVVRHGGAEVDTAGARPLTVTADPTTPATPLQRQTLLQEANERLVLAALGAQELQAAAERAQQRQADLMAAVADELGNPFAPIRLTAAALGLSPAEDPLLPRLQAIIDQQAAHMSRLVRAASQRASTGGDVALPSQQTSDIGAAVETAVHDLGPLLALRQQRLSLDLPAGPIAVRGDAVHLAQVLCNLLDNASKFTPDLGAIHLAASLDGASVRLSVSDDGIGIGAAEVPGIFEPFGQPSHAVGCHGASVGIGLPVVRALVAELGGSVVAESAGNGRGSRFVVRLPLAAPGDGAAPS
jgi:diguanylate cyclase (GGDEF)-like protein